MSFIAATAKKFYNLVKGDIELHLYNLVKHLHSLIVFFDKSSAVSVAVSNNNNLTWNEDVFSRDASMLRQFSCWEEFFIKTHMVVARDGFNFDKVKSILSADPEYDRLVDLAEEIRYDVPIDFIRSGPLQELRKLQQVISNIYSCLYYKLWCKGRGVILRLQDIPDLFFNTLYFMDSHWTPKQDSSMYFNLGLISLSG